MSRRSPARAKRTYPRVEWDNGELNPCNICGWELHGPEQFIRHVYAHHHEDYCDGEYYHCCFCSKPQSSRSNMTRHLKAHFGVEDSPHARNGSGHGQPTRTQPSAHSTRDNSPYKHSKKTPVLTFVEAFRMPGQHASAHASSKSRARHGATSGLSDDDLSDETHTSSDRSSSPLPFALFYPSSSSTKATSVSPSPSPLLLEHVPVPHSPSSLLREDVPVAPSPPPLLLEHVPVSHSPSPLFREDVPVSPSPPPLLLEDIPVSPIQPFFEIPAAPAPPPPTSSLSIVPNNRAIDWDHYVQAAAQLSPEARQTFIDDLVALAQRRNDPDYTQALLDSGILG
ncbi:hypothetical protein PHLGIDRAFT_121395 [Phlebiopsis gigantea 11061_1 CR5-6]|uniref:C2H2-type domain-containing protein n=1 Tax=Phlebiopsis gigantea (strain 11061_1 CR5-6) TaxID=745531 RepID=A0A0C3RT00_PHLG1|nr:hypothetical protein PHLGIDRAFT_121395 [Phlebiopsis gigantea 11061_1 CR5-6]